jgi:hypothetical protein
VSARNRAVMQTRGTSIDELDYFPTPPFATRALLEFLEVEVGPLTHLSAWEPACGEGHMVRPLEEALMDVRASDIASYGEHEIFDFAIPIDAEQPVDFVITNPPFKAAQRFIDNGLQIARVGVAMLVRSAFLESQARYESLYSVTPPTFVLQFAERVVMLKGRLVRAGSIDPLAEKPGTKASTATSYCWLLWLRKRGQWDGDTRLRWIPSSLSRLERAGDYPVLGPDLFGEVRAA